MKLAAALFAASLATNVVLVGVISLKSSGASQTGAEATKPRSAVGRGTDAPNATRPETGGATNGSIAAETSPQTAPLWSSLDSPDLRTLIGRLRAAGFPVRTVKNIVLARIDSLFVTRMREIAGVQSDKPYWQGNQGFFGPDPKYYEAMGQLYRERAGMIREALADDFFAQAPQGAADLEQRRQIGSLPKNKADAVQRIADDYTEMASRIRTATGGIMLPEDKEQLALLDREKRADLAAVLSPQELEEYEMRTSPVTQRLRSVLTLMGATEPEFRAIYAAQKQFSDGFDFAGPVAADRRLEAQRQAAEQIKTALGEQRYADYTRSNNGEFRRLNDITLRENLPSQVAVQAFNQFDAAAQQSTRIFDDAALTLDQKRTALRALADSTRTQIRSTLGPTVGETYLRNANWLSMMENGGAINFSADGSALRTRSLPSPEKKTP